MCRPTLFARRSGTLACLLTGALVACSGTLGPGDTLTGRYSNDGTILQATSRSVSFQESCLKATLPPLELDANLEFSGQATSLTLLGNVNWTGTEVLLVSGRLDGDHLTLYVMLTRPQGPPVDPVQVNLRRNGPTPDLFCPA